MASDIIRRGGGKRELVKRVTDDVLKEAWKESRVAEKLRKAVPKSTPPVKRTIKPPSSLKSLRGAEKAVASKLRKKAIGRLAARAVGRAATPLAVGLSIYDVGKAGVEGYRAYKAHKEAKAYKAKSEAKYGSIEKHRRALRRARQTRRPPEP